MDEVKVRHSNGLPGWATVVLAVASGVAPAFTAWGALNERLHDLERRVQVTEHAQVTLDREVKKGIESLDAHVRAVELTLARLCAKVHCPRAEE